MLICDNVPEGYSCAGLHGGELVLLMAQAVKEIDEYSHFYSLPGKT